VSWFGLSFLGIVNINIYLFLFFLFLNLCLHDLENRSELFYSHRQWQSQNFGLEESRFFIFIFEKKNLNINQLKTLMNIINKINKHV
jgi:hypothetical protein